MKQTILKSKHFSSSNFRHIKIYFVDILLLIIQVINYLPTNIIISLTSCVCVFPPCPENDHIQKRHQEQGQDANQAHQNLCPQWPRKWADFGTPDQPHSGTNGGVEVI